MMPTNCTESQETKVMLAHAYIADLGSKAKGNDCNTAREVSQLMEEQLNTYEIVKGNWKLVWGPYVYKFPLISKFRDNTFYVAQSTQDASQYVLAIAGTNPTELWDWVFEDFMVGEMTHWSYGSAPSAAKISASAALSLAILHNAVACSGIAGACQTLKDFLRGAVAAASGSVGLTVTGHSLGGEMASTAALWLADTQGPQSVRSDEWDPDNKVTVSAYCYAGPTAGNKHWAEYYDSRLGERTCRVWNSMDIVPHAWNTSDLGQIPDLYRSAGIKMEFPLKALLETIKLSLEVSRKEYTQIIEGQPPLAGQADKSKGDTFFLQAGYQHVDAYLDLLGMPPLGGISVAPAQEPQAGPVS